MRPFAANATGRIAARWTTVSMTSWSFTSEVLQRTAAAVAGTERLSSSRIGSVSAAAAASAARNGIHVENQGYGGGTTRDTHHQQRNAPAAPPNSTNAALPARVRVWFHGTRGLRMRRPTIDAIPSPAAMMPQA